MTTDTMDDMILAHREFIDFMDWGYTKKNLEVIALIHEEVSELGREIRQKEIDWDKVELECADIVLRTMDFAYEHNFSLGQAVKRKMKINWDGREVKKAQGRIK